ncbi:MAG TPA: lipoyl(octanoyl) transferase LipB [Blastocatellia bacterium]|nr:lipoyl(octanoyl) transferase LipB [Blastocatellia bacterium]
MTERICEVRRLGIISYEAGLKMQEAAVEARAKGMLPDMLLLLQHPHVLTLGRGADPNNVLVDENTRRSTGVELFKTGRGGDVTYHGPGQVVGYPIIDLKPDRCDVHRYVRDIEEVMIRVTSDYGIDAIRIPGLTGIWVSDEKLGAIGVRIARWVTSHGFAYNVNTDLSYFNLIVPCGISDHGVTSLKKLLGREVDIHEVQDRLAYHFGQVFQRKMLEVSSESKSIQTYIYRHENGGHKYLLLRRIESRGAFWQPVTGRLEPGEDWHDAAVREVWEETKLRGEIIDLNFRHSFLVDPRFWKQHPEFAIKVNEESSYMMDATGAKPDNVILDPTEHDAYEWVDYDTAMNRVIWEGNKKALKLAEAAIASTVVQSR